MEEKEKKELDPLPDDTSTTYHKLEKRITCTLKEHDFEMIGGVAECKKCHAGFNLGGGAWVQDGHIYINQELVI